MRIRISRASSIVAAGAFAATLVMATAVAAAPVSSGTTKLALDPDTAEGFADMSIGIEPTGAARFAQGFFKFPIKGGELNNAGSKGLILHKGGISFFTEGGPGVKFTQFEIKVGANKAKVFAKSEHAGVRLFDIDLEGQAQGKAFDFRIKDADTTLAKDGAGVLSETFDFPFHKGLEMGHTTIKLTRAS
jgi:hypothetical protein